MMQFLIKAQSTAVQVIGQASASSATAQGSLATSTTLTPQAGDDFFAVIASSSPALPTFSDTAGDAVGYMGAVTSQSGIYLYGFEVMNGATNAADTFTARGTGIQAIAVLQVRGLVASQMLYFPTAPASVGMVSGTAIFGDHPQAAPGTGTDAITSNTATPQLQPAMVIGFSAIPGEAGAAVNAAPTAGTGFTAQTGVWATWGGGAGAYLGVFETETVSSTSAVAATFTAQSAYGTGNYGTFVWIVPELSAVP